MFDIAFGTGYDLLYIIRGHGFWILKMYKGIKNCVLEIKDAFWMFGSAFGMGYDLVYNMGQMPDVHLSILSSKLMILIRNAIATANNALKDCIVLVGFSFACGNSITALTKTTKFG